MDPNDEECLWGYDYENPLSQKNHRVVYYETLGEPNPDAPFPNVDWDEGGWPIGGFDCESGPLEIEYGMTFEVREQGVTASGYDYYDVFGAKWDESTRMSCCPRHTRTRIRTSLAAKLSTS